MRLAFFVLVVAALQTLLPVAAYGHMAGQGTLTLHLCSASGERRSVTIDITVGSELKRADNDRHDCCPGATPPPVSDSAVSLALPDTGAGALKVGGIFYQRGAPVLVPPATGPPA